MTRSLLFILTLLLTLGKLDAQNGNSEERNALPAVAPETAFKLFQNFPNPVKENTFIKLQLNTAGAVSLKIYDMLGNPVSTLLDQNMIPGVYSVEVETAHMPNGIYFYVLKKEELSQTMKMIISR